MKKFKKNQQKLWFTGKETYRKTFKTPDIDSAKPAMCLNGAKFLSLLGFTDEDEVTSDEVCIRLVEIGLTKANQIIDSCLYFTHPEYVKER